MGWWSEESKEKDLIIGDEPLDVVGEMLDKLLAAYQEEVGRKPTPDELAKTLEIALSTRADEVLGDMEGKEVAGVAIKLKKRLVKKNRPKIGDYFAVPLPHGGYGYGRIEDVVLSSLMLVQFLKIASRELLSMEQVVNAPSFFECACGRTGLIEGEWIVLGNDPSLCRKYEGTERERADAFLFRLNDSYGHLSASELLEERLGRTRRV